MFPFFIHFYSKVKETEETSKRGTPLIEKIAEFYAKSDFCRKTKDELDQLLKGQKRKSSAFKEITYATSFCHQLRWISKRSFKNLLGNPQASIAQVTWQILRVMLGPNHVGTLGSDIIYFRIIAYHLLKLPFIYPHSVWDIKRANRTSETPWNFYLRKTLFFYVGFLFSFFLFVFDYIIKNFCWFRLAVMGNLCRKIFSSKFVK